mmetsp:Transcript_10537/g.33403  ORF Transcript_10537/g.33403 Transcript_10537/m.33403 type:complete len:253 (+) Transcript_10537:1675-2433(+)
MESLAIFSSAAIKRDTRWTRRSSKAHTKRCVSDGRLESGASRCSNEYSGRDSGSRCSTSTSRAPAAAVMTVRRFSDDRQPQRKSIADEAKRVARLSSKTAAETLSPSVPIFCASRKKAVSVTRRCRDRLKDSSCDARSDRPLAAQVEASPIDSDFDTTTTDTDEFLDRLSLLPLPGRSLAPSSPVTAATGSADQSFVSGLTSNRSSLEPPLFFLGSRLRDSPSSGAGANVGPSYRGFFAMIQLSGHKMNGTT